MRKYEIEVETRPNVFGTCVDASVIKGPVWARGFRSMAWAQTREEAFAKVRNNLTERLPQHALTFVHTAA